MLLGAKNARLLPHCGSYYLYIMPCNCNTPRKLELYFRGHTGLAVVENIIEETVPKTTQKPAIQVALSLVGLHLSISF
jgi:hypothetical protein